MPIVCSDFRERISDPLRGVADLALELAGGIQLQIKNWAIYAKAGQRYVNPPAIRYNGGIANIIRIPQRSHRELFRESALLAIDDYLSRQGDESGESRLT